MTTPESICYHEDDYCQIELLPLEAWPFCERQLHQIHEFAEAHREGTYYTDIYLRDESPRPLRDVALTLADLDAVVGLPCFATVKTNYGQDVAERTTAWGPDIECAILADTDDQGVVEHIWLILEPEQPAHAGVMEEAIGRIATRGRLLLVDWSWDLLVNPLNAGELRGYLEYRLK